MYKMFIIVQGRNVVVCEFKTEKAALAASELLAYQHFVVYDGEDSSAGNVIINERR